MTPEQIDKIVQAHYLAESNGDVEGATASYTDDICHDLVGAPDGQVFGIPAVRARYTQLFSDFRSDDEQRLHTYYSENAVTCDDLVSGVVTGSMLGIPGHGRRVTFRILHVFEFRDDKICRENVWLDAGAIVAQLAS